MDQLPVAAAEAAGLSDSDSLIVLITVESLLFAALAVSVTLADETKTGRPKVVRGPKLAWAISAAIFCVSFGAMMAWLQLFCSHTASGFRAHAVAVAIVVGIVVQPVLAGWISSGVK